MNWPPGGDFAPQGQDRTLHSLRSCHAPWSPQLVLGAMAPAPLLSGRMHHPPEGTASPFIFSTGHCAGGQGSERATASHGAGWVWVLEEVDGQVTEASEAGLAAP